jgi:hypothetical protein
MGQPEENTEIRLQAALVCCHRPSRANAPRALERDWADVLGSVVGSEPFKILQNRSNATQDLR